MRRLVISLVATLGLTAAAPLGVDAQIDLTQSYQAILSCNDGHSAILWIDETALTSLAADVTSINTSGTGLSCTLDTATVDPSTQSADWTVYDYNPSDQAIAPRHSPDSMPAATSGNTTTFPFLAGGFTALLTTTDPSLTGDLSTKTLMDDISVSGPATGFMTQKGGGDCSGNVPAAVRFYFVSPSASGSTVGTPPAGFYTRFWWSNPVNMPLPPSGPSSNIITASVGDPTQWSDWNGQRPNPVTNPTVYEAFEKAIQNVQTVGLSFGGECFFETGVAADYGATNPPPFEIFSSTFSE